MKFLKKFFDDDSTIVGLCRFELAQRKKRIKSEDKDMFFNPFIKDRNFQTNYTNNALLNV